MVVIAFQNDSLCFHLRQLMVQVTKSFSFKIELVRRQYSGNAKKVIKGIGVVTCIYVKESD
jgi:hypothetical protein